MTTTVFDIETEGLPIEELAHLAPEFTAPANYKDPAKIEAYVAEQQAKWLADGALSAVTGRVLCIGTLTGAKPDILDHPDERDLLLEFWAGLQAGIFARNLFVGFCCKTFDLPFLVRRSWHHSIQVPTCLWAGRYWSQQFVDVAERWALLSREPRDRISLDNLSKFLGTGRKTGNGRDFGPLWRENREAALEYVTQDLFLTKAAYERLGPVE